MQLRDPVFQISTSFAVSCTRNHLMFFGFQLLLQTLALGIIIWCSWILIVFAIHPWLRFWCWVWLLEIFGFDVWKRKTWHHITCSTASSNDPTLQQPLWSAAWKALDSIKSPLNFPPISRAAFEFWQLRVLTSLVLFYPKFYHRKLHLNLCKLKACLFPLILTKFSWCVHSYPLHQNIEFYICVFNVHTNLN